MRFFVGLVIDSLFVCVCVRVWVCVCVCVCVSVQTALPVRVAARSKA